MRNFKNILFSIILASILVACGSGSNSDTSANPPDSTVFSTLDNKGVGVHPSIKTTDGPNSININLAGTIPALKNNSGKVTLIFTTDNQQVLAVNTPSADVIASYDRQLNKYYISSFGNFKITGVSQGVANVSLSISLNGVTQQLYTGSVVVNK